MPGKRKGVLRLGIPEIERIGKRFLRARIRMNRLDSFPVISKLNDKPRERCNKRQRDEAKRRKLGKLGMTLVSFRLCLSYRGIRVIHVAAVASVEGNVFNREYRSRRLKRAKRLSLLGRDGKTLLE